MNDIDHTTETEALVATLQEVMTRLDVENLLQVLETHQLGPYMQHPQVEVWGHSCMGCNEFMDPARAVSPEDQMLAHQAAMIRARVLDSL